MNLKGRNVLVTGAAIRLGQEIALTLAGAGANILIHYQSSRKEAGNLQKQIQGLGVQAFLCPFDFSVKENFQKKIKSYIQKLPLAVDVLVNNAAIFYPTPIEKLKEKDWDHFMRVNLKAPVFLAHQIGFGMKKRRRGVIINLVDIAGEKPFLDYLPYSISKAGLIAATRGLAKELAPHVLVNAVAPGPILEPPHGLTSANKKKIMMQTLLKRFGKPCDIAHAVKYLAEANFVTGEVLKVDGGKSLNIG